MRAIPVKQPLLALSVTASLMLGLITVAMTAEGTGTPSGSTETGASNTPEDQLNPLRNLPLGSFTATTERPLFSPSRRPPPKVRITRPATRPAPPTRPRVVEAAPPVNPFKLIGTLIVANQRVALLNRPKDNAHFNVRQDDVLEGWTVRSVRTNNVLLVNGKTRVQLSIFD